MWIQGTYHSLSAYLLTAKPFFSAQGPPHTHGMYLCMKKETMVREKAIKEEKNV